MIKLNNEIRNLWKQQIWRWIIHKKVLLFYLENCSQVKLFYLENCSQVKAIYFSKPVVIISKYRITRSSHCKCSIRKGVHRNFSKFTGKHQCQSLFFNKVACLRPATLLKTRPWLRCFPLNLVKFLEHFFHRTPLVAACVLSTHIEPN